MNLAEKIRSMSDEELVDAAAVALGWLSSGMPDQQRTQAIMPVLKGIAEVVKPGMSAWILGMPWEEAVWAIAEGIGG